jgi:hypothetical protein
LVFLSKYSLNRVIRSQSGVRFPQSETINALIYSLSGLGAQVSEASSLCQDREGMLPVSNIQIFH